MNPYADMYPDEWTPPCPKEEQAADECAEWMKMMQRTKNDKEE